MQSVLSHRTGSRVLERGAEPDVRVGIGSRIVVAVAGTAHVVSIVAPSAATSSAVLTYSLRPTFPKFSFI